MWVPINGGLRRGCPVPCVGLAPLPVGVPLSALPHLSRPGADAHGYLLSQMPRGGGGSGNRRNQNASSRRTARPPHACSQPCCRLDHRCCRRPPRRPRHPLSTLCPRSLAPSLRCPAHRSVARGRASSAPCSEALQRFPGPTVEAPRMFSAGSSRCSG